MKKKTLKEVMEKLLEVEINLMNLQVEFVRTQKDLFPFLEHSSITDLQNEVSKLLDQMLSSCLKVKTGRIEIPWKGGWGDLVILTMNPGLKAPYCSYRAISLEDTSEIKDGNLTSKESWKAGSWIMLSCLENHHWIHQDRLERFYELLKATVDWMNSARNFPIARSKYHGDNAMELKLSPRLKFEIKVESEGWMIDVTNKDKDLDHHSMESNELWEYSLGPVYSRKDMFKEGVKLPLESSQYSSDLQAKRIILANWDVILWELKRLERKKKEMIKSGKMILKDLLDETKGFRFLQKLES